MLYLPMLLVPGAQKYLNWPCASLQHSRWNCMSIEFLLRGIIVSLATPTAGELSNWIGDRGCGQPISTSAWRSGTIYLSQM